MSQSFTWKCKGERCNVMFSDADWSFKKRYCEKCLRDIWNEKKKIAYGQKHQRVIPNSEIILDIIKRQPCSAYVLMSYTGISKQNVLNNIGMLRKQYKVPFDKYTRFYSYGGMK